MQGYILLACDHNKYRDMAINIAYSLRVMDPHRSICLIHNSKIDITPECRALFDHFVLFESKPEFIGVMNKARLYDLSPYEQTMYLDADMLLMRPNIDAYWRELDGQFFNMTGNKKTSGRWYAMDIADVMKKFNIPYVVKLNSGVIYFEKSPKTAELFARVLDIFANHRDSLSTIHQGRAGQWADEPFFGIAMGEYGIAPQQNIDCQGSWMITTTQTRAYQFNLENGVCYLQKSKGYPFRQKWLSRGWVDHSPNFVHFVNLQPRQEYEAAVAWFRNKFTLDPAKSSQTGETMPRSPAYNIATAE